MYRLGIFFEQKGGISMERENVKNRLRYMISKKDKRKKVRDAKENSMFRMQAGKRTI